MPVYAEKITRKMILGTYHDTYGELLEDEWLLKLREDPHTERKGGEWIPGKVGFFSKLNKSGELPVAFLAWGGGREDTIYIFRETYRTGWKIFSWRFGKSQNWAVLRHPEGFTVEIYLTNFLEIMKEDIVDRGYLAGEYIWSHNKLIKK